MSGPSASTIDYVFFRGCTSVSCKLDSDVAIAQHRPIFVQFDVPFHPVDRLEASLGAAYWRSAAKQRDFPAGISLVQPAYEATSPEKLQGYYDRFSNFLQLSTKRTVRTRETPRWASRLSAEDKQALHDKEAVVARLSCQASVGSADDRRLLATKKIELETLITCYARRAPSAQSRPKPWSSTSRRSRIRATVTCFPPHWSLHLLQVWSPCYQTRCVPLFVTPTSVPLQAPTALHHGGSSQRSRTAWLSNFFSTSWRCVSCLPTFRPSGVKR